MALLCPQCRNGLYLNCSNILSILGEIAPTQRGIRITSINLNSNNVSKAIPLVFICPNGHQDIEFKDCIYRCDSCDHEQSISNLFLLRGVSGLYCNYCAERYFPNSDKTPGTNLSSLPVIFGG